MLALSIFVLGPQTLCPQHKSLLDYQDTRSVLLKYCKCGLREEQRDLGAGSHQIQPESQWESPEHLPNESIIWALIIARLIGDASDPTFRHLLGGAQAGSRENGSREMSYRSGCYLLHVDCFSFLSS